MAEARNLTSLRLVLTPLMPGRWEEAASAQLPLERARNLMPDWLWPLYDNRCKTVTAALMPALIDHRDRICADHIGVPLDF